MRYNDPGGGGGGGLRFGSDVHEGVPLSRQTCTHLFGGKGTHYCFVLLECHLLQYGKKFEI